MGLFEKVLVICLLLAFLAGCAYGGAQLKPAKHEKDGKPASGDYRVQSVFTF
jgi:hypothetical protein